MALPGISRFSNRVALVTGASSGIGAAITESLVKHGLVVVGCARNPAPIEDHARNYLENKYPGKLQSYKCDVGNEEEVERMFQWIETNLGGVDVCINSAGVMVADPLLDADPAKLRNMLNINFIGLVMCTKLAVKSMRARGVDDGHIININSMLGHRIRGHANGYAASKFAVTALNEGFRRELRAANLQIRISSVSPGLTRSNFHYTELGAERAEKLYDNMPCILPEDVANAVVHALSQPAHVQVQDILLESTRANT